MTRAQLAALWAYQPRSFHVKHPGVAAWVLVLAVVPVVVWGALLLLSCGGSERGSFAADVASCELAPTCEEAVRCRSVVAVKHHRPPETVGRCEREGGSP